MNKYEGLFILENASKEEVIKDEIDKIQAAIKQSGGTVQNVQKMDQRPFARAAGQRDSGYYVNFIFQAPPKAIGELDAKFHLETGLLRWQFTKHQEPIPEEEEKKKRRRKKAEEAAGLMGVRSRE